MRISDWSSDVCSSDLQGGLLRAKGLRQRIAAARLACQFGGNRRCADRDRTGRDLGRVADPAREAFRAEILDLATPDGRNTAATQQKVALGHLHQFLRHQIGRASWRESGSQYV